MDEQSLLPSLPPSLAPFAWSAGPRNADLSSVKKAMHSYERLWRGFSVSFGSNQRIGYTRNLYFTINVSPGAQGVGK